jgi:four helix bundle protein
MGRRVGGQLIRCGTASAPNYAETRAAECRNDFVHKLGVAHKELRETRVWRRLCAKSGLLPADVLASLIDECTQLMNIVGNSIVTAKERARKPLGPLD